MYSLKPVLQHYIQQIVKGCVMTQSLWWRCTRVYLHKFSGITTLPAVFCGTKTCIDQRVDESHKPLCSAYSDQKSSECCNNNVSGAQHVSRSADACLQHGIQHAEIEAAGGAEQQDAWHRHLSTEVDGQGLVEVYRKLYLQWLQQPMAPCTANEPACTYRPSAIYRYDIACWLRQQSYLCCSWSWLMPRLLLTAGECVCCAA